MTEEVTNPGGEARGAGGSGFLYWLGVLLHGDGRFRLPLRMVVLLTFAIFLRTSFYTGWTKTETDFPNYYTAAVLARQGQPLRKFYDWTWFARQMSYAGEGVQLGTYTAQTPLTMLPMVPLARFPMQRAKQIWLACNLIFLIAAVWLMSRMTRVRLESIWLLAFCGYFSLRANFVLGQYYVFLLFLLTLAFYFIHQGRFWPGGATSGLAFGLKLYGGPLLLYFAVRRQWKALLGMIAAALLLVGLAIALFGVADVRYYATQVLPRSLEGGSLDPYTPWNPTFTTLLRRMFMREAELNPHPLWDAPQNYFFLRSFVSIGIVVFLVLGAVRKRASERHNFAWFVIAAMLLSTSLASYSFIVLLLPAVLLLEEAGPRESAFLVSVYVLLSLPLHPVALFPKVWLLAALFVVAGMASWRALPWEWVVTGLAFAATVALFNAERQMGSYAYEPAQKFERVAVRPGAIFSSFPVVTPAGIFYQSMGTDSYVLRRLHENRDEELMFAGHAFLPRLAADGKSVEFELVGDGGSKRMQFDPLTSETVVLPGEPPGDWAHSVVSPDGKWIAFEQSQDGPTRIWLREAASGKERELRGGNCNSFAPAWDLDSMSFIFASDCGRGFGLPALYRARISEKAN
jgi:Glycosyltransferase family 87/WD40-like Beta Propeller Repeat